MHRVALFFALSIGCGARAEDVRPGDLVFHTSHSAQSAIIAQVTRSPWTHVGLVFERDGGELWVLEAVEPVRWTRLEDWIDRGDGLAVRRLREPLTSTQLRALEREGARYLGRRYDARFEWSDRRMYCSELVWKVFERALGVRLSEPQRWRDLNLPPRARALARRRLGRLPPPSARIVTPVALADSPLLFAP
jgi:hypothetical protein